MASINCLNPEWFWGLLIIPLLYYIYIRASKKRKAAAIKFSNVSLIRLAAEGKKFHWRKHISFYLLILIFNRLESSEESRAPLAFKSSTIQHRRGCFKAK